MIIIVNNIKHYGENMEDKKKSVKTPVEKEDVAVREARLDKGVAFFKKTGVVVPFVDTCRDLDKKGKADLLNDILVRAKNGKPVKFNPYIED